MPSIMQVELVRWSFFWLLLPLLPAWGNDHTQWTWVLYPAQTYSKANQIYVITLTGLKTKILQQTMQKKTLEIQAHGGHSIKGLSFTKHWNPSNNAMAKTCLRISPAHGSDLQSLFARLKALNIVPKKLKSRNEFYVEMQSGDWRWSAFIYVLHDTQSMSADVLLQIRMLLGIHLDGLMGHPSGAEALIRTSNAHTPAEKLALFFTIYVYNAIVADLGSVAEISTSPFKTPRKKASKLMKIVVAEITDPTLFQKMADAVINVNRYKWLQNRAKTRLTASLKKTPYMAADEAYAIAEQSIVDEIEKFNVLQDLYANALFLVPENLENNPFQNRQSWNAFKEQHLEGNSQNALKAMFLDAFDALFAEPSIELQNSGLQLSDFPTSPLVKSLLTGFHGF